MNTITYQQVMRWHPCYSRDRVKKLFDRPYTLAECLSRPTQAWKSVPATDLIWLFSHAVDERTARLFAVRCARWALAREHKAGREPDPRSWAACDAAERFAIGEATQEELAAAADAARDAAWAAAAWAAADAAWAAADAVATAADAAYPLFLRWAREMVGGAS